MLKTLRHVFAPTALYRGEGVCGGAADDVEDLAERRRRIFCLQ